MTAAFRVLKQQRLGGLLAGVFGVLLLFQVPQAWSQESALNVPVAYDKAVQALESGDFDAGLAALEPVLKEHQDDGLEMFGPVFGHFFYLKGILLIRKGDFTQAIGPLKICYEKFDNESLKKQAEGEPKLPNRFRFQALAQWAGCHLMLKQHAEASGLYEKVLAEAGDDPEVNRGEAQINLAVCYLNMPEKQDKGRDFLLTQLKANAWTAKMKRRIFLSLANEWTPKVPLSEIVPVLAEAAPLLRQAEASERFDLLNPAFGNLAATALQTNEPLRALAWYHLMADPLEEIQELARQHQLIIFADEIYDKMLYDGAEHISIASLADDVLRNDEKLSVRFSRFERRHDVGMPQFRGGLGFA